MLTSLFAVKWRLFPVSGFVYITDRPWEWFRSLVLPATAVSLGGIASLAKQTCSAMLDVFSRDFVRVMQANGFSRRSVVYRHALRNAAIPVVTIIGVVSVGLLGTRPRTARPVLVRGDELEEPRTRRSVGWPEQRPRCRAGRVSPRRGASCR